MFCNNCGAELKDDTQVCPVCGSNPSQEVPANIPTLMDRNSLSTLFIVAAVLHLVELICWFIKSIRGSSLGIISETISMYEGCILGNVTALTVIYGIACLTAAVVCLYPIFTSSLTKRRMLIYPKIWSILVLAFVIYMMSSLSSAAGELGGMVKYSLTLGGWLMILSSIASLIVLFMISSRTKQYDD